MQRWGNYFVHVPKEKLTIRLSHDILVTPLITQAFGIVCCRGLEG